ncbi:hypothetical protein B0H13DRAFT_2265536 [Mycena leptocephala]|nr:hypothetical protein B0H13DRAFT_2265536 [Mycena leptocephala]
MFPNYSRSHNSSSSLPATTLPPHHRNRIACTNCRRRKVKVSVPIPACITGEKQPLSPCKRCVKEKLTCEYVAVSNADETVSTRLSQDGWSLLVLNRMREVGAYYRNNLSMYAGYHAQQASPPDGQMAPFPQPGYSSHSGFNSSGRNIPGNYLPPVAAPSHPATSASHVHYGPFPGPAKTMYPWTLPPQESGVSPDTILPMYSTGKASLKDTPLILLLTTYYIHMRLRLISMRATQHHPVATGCVWPPLFQLVFQFNPGTTLQTEES